MRLQNHSELNINALSLLVETVPIYLTYGFFPCLLWPYRERGEIRRKESLACLFCNQRVPALVSERHKKNQNGE